MQLKKAYLKENSVVYRDLFDTKIMNMPGSASGTR